jgi:hypothetical protein
MPLTGVTSRLRSRSNLLSSAVAGWSQRGLLKRQTDDGRGMTMLGVDKKPPKAVNTSRRGAGRALELFFTPLGSEVEWKLRAAVNAGEDGRKLFEQHSLGFEEALS